MVFNKKNCPKKISDRTKFKKKNHEGLLKKALPNM
jgi:hypothetical protein